jgi:P-type Ca2+ transporter type 2C
VIQEKEFTRGLSTREAEKRVKTYGLNELKHNKKKSPVLIFLAQFNDFLVWVLIGATIISGFIGDKADAITILIIVIVNAILGFVQEFRTEKSLEALQELAAPTCKVIRDGNIKVVSAYLLMRLEKQIMTLTFSINKLNTIISTKLGIVIDNE